MKFPSALIILIELAVAASNQYHGSYRHHGAQLRAAFCQTSGSSPGIFFARVSILADLCGKCDRPAEPLCEPTVGQPGPENRENTGCSCRG